MSDTPKPPGRPAIHGQAMSNAQRQATFKQRRREAEEQRQREEAAGRERVRVEAAEREERHTDLRRAFGKTLMRASWLWHFPTHYDGIKAYAGDTPERDELREYARQLGEALCRGDKHLP